jgi:hypothetical protein
MRPKTKGRERVVALDLVVLAVSKLYLGAGLSRLFVDKARGVQSRPSRCRRAIIRAERTG